MVIATSPLTGVLTSLSPKDRFVVRGRLLAGLLEDGVESVILVNGPAGSGKSTLARQWADLDDRTHLEVSASPALNDPAALAQCLISAFEEIGPPARKTRSVVTADEPTFSASLLPALRTLAASRSRPYVLVVDDAHLIDDARAHRVLASVAYGMPQGSTLAVLSRERSPVWLATFRADGRLLEIGNEELSFDVSEAEALFVGLGLHVSRPEVVRAVDSTGGWPVGLYLGALELPRRQPTDHVSAFPDLRGWDRATRSYVRWQILDPLDPDTRHFLVHCAVFDDLIPELCDAVLERRDSLAKLTWLEENIQLIVEVSREPRRFRLHHLLGEALLAELQSREPEVLPGIHSRMAEWYHRHGDLDAAIRHAQAAGDLPLVGDLVWSAVLSCVGSGQLARHRQWLSPLSDADVTADRWLTLAAAWSCLQAGDRVRMGGWLLRAEEHAGKDWRANASGDEYSASLAAITALVGRDGLDDVRDLVDSALQGLPAASPFRTFLWFLRGVGVTLADRLDEGVDCFEQARDLSRFLEVPQVEADATSWLGLLHLGRKQPTAALQLLDEVGEILQDSDLDSLATSAHSLSAHALGEALTHQPRASATLAKARSKMVLAEGIAPWFAVVGRVYQARAAIALGERALARQLLTEAQARTTPDLSSAFLTRLIEEVEEHLRLFADEGVSAAALTPAELRVLQFLPSHLNYLQIGESLYVSPNTVKTHALAIYRKLSVSTRADAVARGRTLGLLDELPLEGAPD